MDKLPVTSISFRLLKVGIETVRTPEGVFLEYENKRILRPAVINCVGIVKQNFGIEI